MTNLLCAREFVVGCVEVATTSGASAQASRSTIHTMHCNRQSICDRRRTSNTACLTAPYDRCACRSECHQSCKCRSRGVLPPMLPAALIQAANNLAAVVQLVRLSTGGHHDDAIDNDCRAASTDCEAEIPKPLLPDNDGHSNQRDGDGQNCCADRK